MLNESIPENHSISTGDVFYSLRCYPSHNGCLLNYRNGWAYGNISSGGLWEFLDKTVMWSMESMFKKKKKDWYMPLHYIIMNSWVFAVGTHKLRLGGIKAVEKQAKFP